MTIDEALREMELLDGAVEAQLDQIKAAAAEMGIRPSELRTPDGGWPMVSLLHTKAKVLTAQIMLMRLKEH